MESIIVRDPEIMVGKPIIKGTRITVELILNKLSGNQSIDDILKSYPHLMKEQVLACIEYASKLVSNTEIYDLA